MSFFKLTKRKRTEPKLFRRANIELLEFRRVLSADFGTATADSSWLNLQPEQYSTDSILVRFRQDVRCVAESRSHGLGHDIMPGTKAGPMSNFIPGLATVELGEGVSVQEALATYQGHPDVLYAEPNYRIQVEAVPNDPSFSELWGLHNLGQTAGVVDADIDAAEAWDIATGSGNTVIAVIDTGVDYTHPDLQANMWVNDLELNGIPNFDDDNNGYADDIYGYDFANNDSDPMDDHDHGTHVAGTIGAVGDNSLGITGVNWDIQIMAIKFLRADGSGDLGAAIAAIDYAVANGATISNNSWGFNGSFSPGLYDAIRNAQDAGHIFVAAAGNGNSFGIGQNNDIAPFYPAAYDLENIVSVAALDHEDQLASFSNFGAVSVDLGAPGVNILSTTIGNTYEYFNGTSMATPHVAGTLALVKDTHPEWTQAQLMAAVMETVDPVSDLQGRSITGGRLNAFQALNFSGPEIQVRHKGQQITDGSGTVVFPDTLPGVPVRETISVQNVGLDDLILDPAISLPTGYSLVASFGQTILAPGESTTFEVALNATELGNYIGEISFGNNDANEGTFNFNLAGKVSNVLKLDDGDTGFFTSGQWTPWLNQGFNNDITFSSAGNGSDVATWDFDVLPGRYAVAATWSILSNRATDAPYTVYDGNSVQGTVRVNQEITPNDFQDFGVGWQHLGEFTVAGGSLRVQLTDDANEFVIADGIRIEKVADLPPGPEIEIRHQGVVVDDELSTVDFGSAFFESSVTEDLVIRNVGSEVLEIGSINIPEGFSLVAPPASNSIAPGDSVTIAIAVDTTELKFRQGEISIQSNDSDESIHNFTLVADVIASSIVDNGQPGFFTNGEWTHWFGEGLDDDMHYSAPGVGNDTASWSFSLTPGDYSVAASWTVLSNRATNTPFTINDGGSPLDTVLVNQKLAPDDFVEQGVGWEQLGQFTITSDTLTVVLSDAANGHVIADAIRIERLDLPPAPEVELSVGGQVIEDGVGVVDFGSTVVSGTIRQIFTVTNRGEQELLLQSPIETSGGFAVSSSFGSTTLAAGESTSFEIEFQASQAGNFNGSLSFGSNDNDESVYNVSLLASASNVLRIDNGDTGFATSGSWINYLYAGYQSDFHYSSKGTGNDRASWTFQVAPGEYQLAATWTTNPNRATDSPFTILDGGSVLSSVTINQELPPNDFTADGTTWETLGTVLVTGNSVTVELTDAANEYVIADAVRLERLGDLPSTPEITVQWNGISLQDGVSTMDFGSTAYGAAIEHTLTVKNAGGGSLLLDPNLDLPAGFSLSSPLGSTSLGPGESTSFAIQLDGLLLGNLSGEFVLGNNDSDENPFNVTLVGQVSSVEIIDNGQPGFESSGEWTHWQLEGFQGDMHYSTSGIGNDTASWTFSVTPGDYSVAASWTTLANRATNSPFTIYDGGTPLNTVLINQELTPNDFVEQGVGWEQLGQFTITSDTLTVVLSDAANEYVIADAIRIERLDLPPAPEVELSVGGQVIEDGVGVVDFGSTVVSGTIRQIFTVTNRGEQELLLQSPIETSGGFAVSSSFGSTTLAAGESTSFEIEFQASQAGNFNGSLSFGSNDNDESVYNVSLLASASNVLRIDNGDTGFATSGSWINYLYAGYQSDFHYSSKGTGNDRASWTFQVAPGEYQLAATWTTNPNRATDSPFTILDGGSVLSSVTINQELPPNDFTADGTTWETLGTVLVTGNSVTVELTDAANEYVIADAVRLERLGDLPSTPEITVQWNGISLQDGVSTMDFGSTAYGAAIEHTLTVKNAGGGSLLLDPNLDLPAGFSLSSPLGSTSLGPGESTSFAIQLDGLLLGNLSGEFVLGNNDSDENPFNVTLVGQVSSVEIIDNGQPGFESSGEWTHWQLEGFQGDMHYSTSGIGNDTASWTFSVTPGDYSVAASWTTLANRATNSPFTIYDGGTPLNTVLINQELTPNDFVEQGVGWEQLGQFTITSDTLTVVLSDAANEYVIADAIRIERQMGLGGASIGEMVDSDTKTDARVRPVVPLTFTPRPVSAFRVQTGAHSPTTEQTASQAPAWNRVWENFGKQSARPRNLQSTKGAWEFLPPTQPLHSKVESKTGDSQAVDEFFSELDAE